MTMKSVQWSEEHSFRANHFDMMNGYTKYVR